jgi:stromal membrane-associated protein
VGDGGQPSRGSLCFGHRRTASCTARHPSTTEQLPSQPLSLSLNGLSLLVTNFCPRPIFNNNPLSQGFNPRLRLRLPAPAPAPAPPQNDLFSLDFHAPSQPAQQQTQPTQPKNAKQDILSLFSTPAPNPATAVPVQQNLWGQPQQPIQQQQQPVQGMMGQTGTGMWGVSSGWNAPNLSLRPMPGEISRPGFRNNRNNNKETSALGHNQLPTVDLEDSSNRQRFRRPTSGQTTHYGATTNNQQKDAFDDIWGGFK